MSRRTGRPALHLALGAALLAAATVAGTTAPAGTAPPAAADSPYDVSHGCVRSVPDPGTGPRVKICYTLFRPPGASAQHPVPMILHSHGWGGSREDKVTGTADSPSIVRPYLDAGYGVLSFDQRGFGDSGGQAHVENPAVEGHDVRRLVDLVGSLSWVEKDGPRDPRLGAIGGSYGGGYQFLAAFELLRRRGEPVLDALAPEITWNDLKDSLAPDGVPRTEWAAVLAAAALPSTALPPRVYQGLAEAAVTGTWPDGSQPGGTDLDAFFAKNGPAWHVSQGRRLDIPVLLGQGMNDNLFNLQQGLTNWRTALTRRARARSIFVGYNGGHVLPNLFPMGLAPSSDPCSVELTDGPFRALALRFMDHVLRGRKTGLRGFGRLHLATAYSSCTTVRSARPDTAFELGDLSTPTAAGPPVVTEIARGPLRIAGSAHLTGTVTTTTPDSRVFYGLAVGSSPLDAKLVQGNVMPLHETAVVNRVRRRIELPAVAIDVPPHQSLYLLATPVSDMFAAMGSRLPGQVTVAGARVHLPVVGPGR